MKDEHELFDIEEHCAQLLKACCEWSVAHVMFEPIITNNGKGDSVAFQWMSHPASMEVLYEPNNATMTFQYGEWRWDDETQSSGIDWRGHSVSVQSAHHLVELLDQMMEIMEKRSKAYYENSA